MGLGSVVADRTIKICILSSQIYSSSYGLSPGVRCATVKEPSGEYDDYQSEMHKASSINDRCDFFGSAQTYLGCRLAIFTKLYGSPPSIKTRPNGQCAATASKRIDCGLHDWTVHLREFGSLWPSTLSRYFFDKIDVVAVYVWGGRLVADAARAGERMDDGGVCSEAAIMPVCRLRRRGLFKALQYNTVLRCSNETSSQLQRQQDRTR